MYVPVFSGFDMREAGGWHAFAQSVIDRASVPIAMIPIGSKMKERDGTNAFTYSRFLIPYLCGFEGFAIFLDGSDMLVRADLAELWELRSVWHAVQVVKHEYRTKHERKYIDTPLESINVDYPCKNWSSVVIWNCSHYRNRVLTPTMVSEKSGEYLHRFGWLSDRQIGDLPPEWNVLIGEQPAPPETKIAHYTLGIPGFRAYRDSDFSPEWNAALRNSLRGIQTEDKNEN